MLPFQPLLVYGNTIIPSTKNVKKFAVSADSGTGVLILYSNGDLYAFGTNTNGKFGTGSTTALTTWTLIASNVRLFTCSHNCTIIIKKDSTVWYSGSVGGIFSNSFGYSFSTVSLFTDMTSAFSQFDIPGIKSIDAYEDSGSRCFIIDGSSQLWGIGSNRYYALGTGSSTAYANWTSIVNGDNARKVHIGLQVTWIEKNDNTFWRAGSNAFGTLAFSSSSATSMNFTQYTSVNATAIQLSQYNLTILVQDGTLRLYGISSSGQLGNGSTSGGTFLSPYTPSLTSVRGLSDSTGGLYSTLIKGGISTYSTGANTNGMLAIGSGTAPTSFTQSFTGVMSNLDYANLAFYTFGSGASYAVIDDEVYASGSAAMTLSSTASVTWTLMTTPNSVLWGNAKYVSTLSNISTTTPNMTRYSHSRCRYGNDKFIIYGGYNGSILNDINIYDANTETWSSVPVTDTTQGRFGSGITVYQDKLYVFAGNNTSSGTTNTMYSVDLVTGVWTTLTTTNTPASRSHVRMCTIGSIIYVWGGEGYSSFYSFNPVTNAFTTLTNSPITSNIDSDMVTDGVDVYVNANNFTWTKYDVSSGLWCTLATKPSSSAMKMTYSNGNIYGSVSAGTGLYVYRIASNIWTPISSVTLPNTSRQCLSSGAGKVYYSGGVNSSATSNFYKIE